MLVHLRLNLPADLTDRVRDCLEDSGCTLNLAVHDGVSLRPQGDVLECDVAREAVNDLLEALADLGVGERGGIVVSDVESAPFTAARELEQRLPGDPADAIIWDAVLDEAEGGAVPTVSSLVFLVLAVTLASVAVITDSSILVVGAMVVGPEFAIVAALCVGLVFGRWSWVGKGFVLLLASFAFAIGVVAVLALLARVFGLVTPAMVTAPRPQTGFIWHPDVWSFVVALVAGTVGVLALSLQKTSTMVGVFISVTTVPAAGNLALGLAMGVPSEIVGSATQLGLNLGGMVLAGSVFLAFQRAAWVPVVARVETLLHGARSR
jgi:uncharacterized hydrophobic protein (TIGR00271 family)